MAATIEYNLRTELRNFLKENEYSDAAEAAQDFFSTIPPEEYGACVEEMLPALVRDVIRQGRPPSGAASGSSASSGTKLETKDRPPSKWTAAKLRLVDKQYSISDGNYMRLGNCTVADLDQLVSAYEQRAADMTDKADRFRKLRAEVAKRKAKTVEQLPARILVEILED